MIPAVYRTLSLPALRRWAQEVQRRDRHCICVNRGLLAQPATCPDCWELMLDGEPVGCRRCRLAIANEIRLGHGPLSRIHPRHHDRASREIFLDRSCVCVRPDPQFEPHRCGECWRRAVAGIPTDCRLCNLGIAEEILSGHFESGADILRRRQ